MARDWPVLTLREAGVALIDCEHRTPPAVASGYPYVAIPQMKQGRLDLTDARRISAEHFAEWTKKARPRADDVILSRRCNPGETVVVPGGLDCALGQNLVLLRADGARVHPPFLRWMVRGPEWWNQIGKFLNAGAIFDSLKCADVPNFRLSVPPLPEQRAIAGVLGALDDKIEVNRKTARVLEGTARAVFTSWFVDFDPVRRRASPAASGAAATPGAAGALPAGLAALFPTRLVDSPIGEVPEGWRVGTIDSLCDSISSGGTPARMNKDYWEGGTIPWFKTGELFDAPLFDSEEYITEAALANSSCKLWPPGTILFALYASPTVGRMGVLTRHGTSNQAAAGLIVKPEYGVPFLLNALFFARAKLQQIAVGAAQQNINQGVLKAHQVLVPSAGLALQFSQMMTPALERQAQLSSQSATLAALRDTLLPKLISGELRIAQAEKTVGRVA